MAMPTIIMGTTRGSGSNNSQRMRWLPNEFASMVDSIPFITCRRALGHRSPSSDSKSCASDRKNCCGHNEWPRWAVNCLCNISNNVDKCEYHGLHRPRHWPICGRNSNSHSRTHCRHPIDRHHNRQCDHKAGLHNIIRVDSRPIVSRFCATAQLHIINEHFVKSIFDIILQQKIHRYMPWSTWREACTLHSTNGSNQIVCSISSALKSNDEMPNLFRTSRVVCTNLVKRCSIIRQAREVRRIHSDPYSRWRAAIIYALNLIIISVHTYFQYFKF